MVICVVMLTRSFIFTLRFSQQSYPVECRYRFYFGLPYFLYLPVVSYPFSRDSHLYCVLYRVTSLPLFLRVSLLTLIVPDLDDLPHLSSPSTVPTISLESVPKR